MLTMPMGRIVIVIGHLNDLSAIPGILTGQDQYERSEGGVEAESCYCAIPDPGSDFGVVCLTLSSAGALSDRSEAQS